MPSTNTITTACPACGKKFELSAELLGAKGKCDHCETKFIVEAVLPASRSKMAQRSKKKKFPFGFCIVMALLGGAGYVGYKEFVVKQIDAVESVKHQPKSEGTADLKAPGNQQDNSEGLDVVPELELDDPKVGKLDDQQPAKKEPKVVDAPARKVTLKTPKKPQRKSSLKKSFPIVEKFNNPDLGQYRRTYPNTYLGWMPNGKEDAEKALNWGDYLGPLGIKVRPHTKSLQGRAAFAANVPNSLKSQDDTLALTAAEVVAIAPGSPSERYLEKGDLIVGIEGEYLKSGDEYIPDWKFMHKSRRGLQVMLGEKIDQAQERGDVRLTVLRYPQLSTEVFSNGFNKKSGKIKTEKIKVEEGDEIHLIVDADGRNDNDHFAWLSPKLVGDAGTLDLTNEKALKPKKAKSGLGDVLYQKSVDGKSLREKGIGVHANSLIVFTVPKGYQFFQTSMTVTHAKADLEARVLVVKQPNKLAVSKTQIWSGKAGNDKVGIQSFEVDVPGDGIITLRSDESTDGRGGDGTVWLDVTLHGDYGTKKLFDMQWSNAWTAWGRVKLNNDGGILLNGQQFDQSISIHANGEVAWQLPKGTKKISGSFSAKSHGTVQPMVFFQNSALPLTGVHKEKLVELRFPIGKTGSYSDTYPKDCQKSEVTARRQTAWLATHQREDGSWPRLAGYTAPGWDTAWCALALMSSGDSQYDEQVRKAAYYIAYETTPSEWTAERSMRLVFLCEYYLRTKDTKVLAAIQASYRQLEACCKTDFMAGHKVNGFGYGIAGQHYGTGHMALAFALVSKTPVLTNSDLVKSVIRHAGEVCVNGTYAYGRGRRFARDKSREHGGGNAMVGPGMLGAILAGGHQSSINEVIERWDASVGDADNSHATGSLGFYFASLAMAAENEEVFLKSMQNFRYKMTNDDNWEGGFLKSSLALDLQSGDGVVANLIHTAGGVLVLNALKHNLAITGKPEFIKKKRIQTDAVSEWGGQVHSYYLRNWCIAKELLGKNAPKGLSKGILELHGLARTMQLVPKTREIVTQQAPQLISEIAKNRSIPVRDKAYAIELLCGLDFQIYTKLEGEKQEVKLQVNQPFHQLNWLDEDKGELYEESPLKLKAKVKISGKSLTEKITFEVNGVEKFNLDQGTRSFKVSKELKKRGKQKYDGEANISFKVGKTAISYKRPLKFNGEMAHSNNINLRRLRLKLRVAPRAYFQSQPLMIAGIAFDGMYPKERMLEVSGPKKGRINIHEGDVVFADIASENFICVWVHDLKFPEMTQVSIAREKKLRVIRGKVEGNLKDLQDLDLETHCQIKSDGGKSVLEYDFGKPITLNGLDANYAGGCSIRVWYKDGDRWIPAVWDSYSPFTGHNPTFPDTEAKLWRVEINHGRDVKLETMRFYHNPNRIIKQEPLIQASKENSFPDISPN